jgi:hypothetical protein
VTRTLITTTPSTCWPWRTPSAMSTQKRSPTSSARSR